MTTFDDVAKIKSAWPDEFADGARCGARTKREGPHEPGGYPIGFHRWPLERRNAWYCGFNIGDTARRQRSPKREIAQ